MLLFDLKFCCLTQNTLLFYYGKYFLPYHVSKSFYVLINRSLMCVEVYELFLHIYQTVIHMKEEYLLIENEESSIVLLFHR